MSLVRSSKAVALQKLNLDRIGDRGMSRVYALWNVYKMGGGLSKWGIRVHSILVLVGEFSRVLIHSVNMNLVWFFMGTKICHGKNSKLGGGFYRAKNNKTGV